MKFHQFKEAVAQKFKLMSQHTLFTTQVEKDALWETYLSSFPEGTNPIYRERTEHDCSCCLQFIRAVGNVVAIIDGKMVSIWDVNTGEFTYQVVADALSNLVLSKPIDNFFLTPYRTAGQDKNFEQMVDRVQTWEHFFVNIPSRFVMRDEQIGPKLSDLRATHDVFLRGLQEITPDAVDTVLELIGQNSLYRGEEHKNTLTEFRKIQGHFHEFVTDADLFVWDNVSKVSPIISRVRNTSIGTLLVDLSEGVELEDAVKKFEAMVAPANYKRPTALVSKAMVKKARAKIAELGLTSALDRRHATIRDIDVNNAFFINRSKGVQSDDPFDQVSGSVPIKSTSKVEEVPVERFVQEVLPRATSVEVVVENRHLANMVSLIGPSDPTAAPLFKWPNNFSWAYQGDVTDSIKERVKAAGGNVTGELCCRLAWEYSDDLDFHMQEPRGGHIYFSNRRVKSSCGGMLDVDANGIDGIKEHPVENIFYGRISDMLEGTYTLKVHNYSRRSSGVGFEVEIELLGETIRMEYDQVLRNGSYIDVAELKYSRGSGVTIKPLLPSTTRSKTIWGINTQVFQKVNCILPSPNFWGDTGVGNRHLFFMLDGCHNEGSARGFFNEFLRADLNEHRKVLEMVGSKIKTEDPEHQLSGVGFSSTQRNSILCRVTGNFTRTIKVLF